MARVSIPSCDGYLASDDGIIWSCWRIGLREPTASPKPRKPRLTGGYLGIKVKINGKRVYRSVASLVLEAFVGPRPPGMEIRHFPDPDITNNALANLCYGTREENEADKLVHGTKQSKLVPADIPGIRARLKAGERGTDLAREYGVSGPLISQIKTYRIYKDI